MLDAFAIVPATGAMFTLVPSAVCGARKCSVPVNFPSTCAADTAAACCAGSAIESTSATESVIVEPL